MKLGVSIMAMRERAHYVDDILERLDAPATVVWDTKRDRYETGQRALLAFDDDPDVTHVLVLQDDCMPCRDLVASVEQAIRSIPDNPISLYFGHGVNGAHQRTNRLARNAPVPSLLRFEGPWWGVAVVFPKALITPMVALSGRPSSSPAYDKRLSRALGKLGVDTYYVLPSLVDHRLDGPSMIEGRDQADRYAHHFIGADASALDIDWASLPVADGHYRPRRRTQARPQRPAPTMAMHPRPSKGEPTLSISLMAHPSRRKMAEQVAAKAGATIVYDARSDRWDTGRRAWQAYDRNATHHVVLQDDCIVPDDFREGLTEALRVVGDNPVGLYLGNVRPATQFMGAMVAHAKATGASWVVGDGPLWGVGVAVPVHMIDAMLAWCDHKPHIAAYDRRLASFFRSQGIECWYTMPSLVDHRTDVASLVQKGRAPQRRARSFAGTSALGVDWTRLPSTTGARYVTYTGAASRQFHRCLVCGYYTPMRHSILQHVREHGPQEARMSHA